MICAQCFDGGHGEIDMRHMTGVIDYHDPGASHGHGQQETCWLECPKCGAQDDCNDSHDSNIDL